jgi:hypothetical protein
MLVMVLLLTCFFLKMRRVFSVVWSGREEPDLDDELLANADMDRSSSQVERVRLRRDQSR